MVRGRYPEAEKFQEKKRGAFMVSKAQIDKLWDRRKNLDDPEATRKKQHEAGKLTARERIELLVDPGSFHELDAFMESFPPKFGRLRGKTTTRQAVITGVGQIQGSPVYLYSQDFTVEAGSIGEREARKVCKIIDLSMQNGFPLIGLNDSGGARVSEGVRNFAFWNIFQRNVMASGVVPQIFAILGPCAGGAVYSPALGDFIFMVKDIGAMFLTGPAVIKAVTGEEVTKEKLGGPAVQAQISGVAHFQASGEKECMAMIQELLSYLPSNNRQEPPRVETGDDPLREDESLREIVPADPKKSYDMRQVIRRIVDGEKFFEVHRGFAANILTGFARLDGGTVGIVANQPRVFAGCLDYHASDKAARFIRFCDAFNIPLITLVDVPGYLPGLEQEYNGIIRHGAKMLFAYAEATVPKITLVLRKAYGGGIAGMCASKERGADELLAWPSAEIAALGAEGAVEIFFPDEIKNAPDPQKRRQELIAEFREQVTSVYAIAATGRFDKIIDPKETRPSLIKALQIHHSKKDSLPWKKHGNIPL
jgi:acetyl-CoA carboxylase carboxyltransferase component